MYSSKKQKGYGARGWTMIFSMFLAYFAAYGAANSVNIMAPYYDSTRGWSTSMLMTALSGAALVGIATQGIVGSMLIKRSPHKTGIIAGISLVISLALWGFVTQVWQYVILLFLVKISADSWSISNGNIVANWFPKKVAVIVGITTFGIPLGAGLGMALMVIFMTISPTFAYTPFIITAIIALVIYTVFLRDRPEMLGLYPDNEPPGSAKEFSEEVKTAQEAVKNNPWTVKRLISTKETWFFLVSAGILLFGAVGFMTQISSIMIETDAEFYYQYGQLALTGVSVFACLGSYLCGLFDQKAGTKMALIISCVLMAVSCFMAATGTLSALLFAMVLLSVFMGGGTNYIISGCLFFWKHAGFSRAYRFVQPSASVLSALGPAVISRVASSGENGYRNSFLLMAVCAIVGAILMILFNHKNIKEKEKQFRAEEAKV